MLFILNPAISEKANLNPTHQVSSWHPVSHKPRVGVPGPSLFQTCAVHLVN